MGDRGTRHKGEKKIFEAALWLVGVGVLGGLVRPVAKWLTIPALLTQEDMARFLVSSAPDHGWVVAMVYRLVFLLMTAIAVTVAAAWVAKYWSWWHGVLMVAPASAVLLPFWPKEDVGSVTAFALITLVTRYVIGRSRDTAKQGPHGLSGPGHSDP